ncbi:MAG TPA: copper chaperone PCu(A)C [Rhodanobacteraceae bacterium]|nr:copper chaperone PCu(A)C [Rhodanobacteraceae bacterium]
MKLLGRTFVLAMFSLTAMTAFAATAVSPAANSVHVGNGWVRWLPANLPAAGYAIIRNQGDKPVRLIGADSADYAMAMLHRSMHNNGKDTMEMVDALGIPAHGVVQLAPGGYHLMLMDARHPIKPGDTVHVSLHFDNGETLQAAWPVRPANASGSSD